MRYLITALVLVACSHKANVTPTTGGGSSGSGSSSGGTTDTRPVGTGNAQSQAVDVQGGAITLEGAKLAVPPGALSSSQTITVTSQTTLPPTQYASASPVYKFGPDGLQFGNPATISLTYTGTLTKPVVYWSNASGGFDALPTTVTAGVASAAVTHFSEGFVAEALTADVGVTANTTITGSDVTSYYDVGVTGNVESVPFDYTTSPPAALIPDGAGGFTTITGTGTADGHFTIANVPVGTAYLKYDAQDYFVSDTRSLNFSQFDFERRNVTLVPATELATQMNFHLETPVPFDVTSDALDTSIEQLEIYSITNAAYDVFDSRRGVWVNRPVPLVDDTDPAHPLLTEVDMPWFKDGYHAQAPMFDALHDDAYLLQLAQVPVAGLTVAYKCIAAGLLPAFSTTAGELTTVDSANLVPAGSGNSLTLNYNWDRGTFISFLPAATEAHFAGFGETAFAIASPVAMLPGHYGPSPDLFLSDISYATTDTPDGGTVSLQGIAISNPFPASDWKVATGGLVSWSKTFDLSGGTGGAARVGGFVYTALDPATIADGVTVAPRISTVQSVHIDGLDFLADQNVSATPSIAWATPAIYPAVDRGPNGEHYVLYSVNVLHLTLDGSNNTQSTSVTRISTFSNAVVIPAGILTAGEHYAVQVEAQYSTALDFAQQPLIDPLYVDESMVASAMFTVSNIVVLP